MTLRLLDSHVGLTLGAELARGGEGAIFAIPNQSTNVAKIYLKEPERDKAEKLKAMPALISESLSKVSAWPTNIVVNPKGKVCGFIMPRIAASADAHKLYSPKSRSTSFPEADFRFIVHVAANVARAFATVHAAGHVIGDINHGHILVGTDGRVVLIDTDSFQLKAGGQLYTCNVGSPLFTPPELQEQKFKGLVRTENHDAFGLAVMLFHLLFMGRHPYSGVWLGQGEMLIERAMREGRFAYGAGAPRALMRRPPGTLELNTFGPEIAGLFESAFSSVASPVRPSATDWLAALENLKSSLVRCAKVAAHYCPNQLSNCPWCKLEGSGVRLFGHKIEGQWVSTADIVGLWTAIDKIPAPTPDPPLPSTKQWSAPADANIPPAYVKPLRKLTAVAVGALGVAGCSSLNGQSGSALVAFILLAIAFFVWPRLSSALRAQLDTGVVDAQRDWEQLAHRWNREASVAVFATFKQGMLKTKLVLDDLPNERQRRLTKLRAEHREYQIRRHLDRFRIDRGQIRGIGPGRAATLASFGIETAFDVVQNKISGISGFGPSLTGELVAWRREKEAQFRYNPGEPIAPAEIARVESEISALRNNHTEILRHGTVRLRLLSEEIPAARRRLSEPLSTAWSALKLAEARKARL